MKIITSLSDKILKKRKFPIKLNSWKIGFFLVCIIFPFQYSEAQEQNEYMMDLYSYNEEKRAIIENTITALGGNKNIRELGAYSSKGLITFDEGEQTEFDYYFLKEAWVKLDFTEEGKQVSVSVYGNNGWFREVKGQINSEVQEVKGEDLLDMRFAYTYENNLFDYEWKGLEIFYEGEIQIGNKEAWVLRLSGFDFGEEVYYISKKDNRPFMKQVYLFHKNGQKVVNYSIDEYLKIGEVWMPKKVTISSPNKNITLEFLNYSTNQDLSKDFFKKAY